MTKMKQDVVDKSFLMLQENFPDLTFDEANRIMLIIEESYRYVMARRKIQMEEQ